ncbi:hypothetical protein CC79DRAFT_1222563 [Sarocladium strictum]
MFLDGQRAHQSKIWYPLSRIVRIWPQFILLGVHPELCMHVFGRADALKGLAEIVLEIRRVGVSDRPSFILLDPLFRQYFRSLQGFSSVRSLRPSLGHGYQAVELMTLSSSGFPRQSSKMDSMSSRSIFRKRQATGGAGNTKLLTFPTLSFLKMVLNRHSELIGTEVAFKCAQLRRK